ncbi:hypothetical protein BIW11_12085 [Tropilaelaps mercedesae]|uniref:C2H2-type domain-containing protein n=1 Tax=Tropilaelaps mercedesae TaxID=418985 RepID=A0A1V9X8T2_9ACAR|nr:hypothetical protein BIW11_12085 [Tropilaelaps mercedesae]
MQRLCQTTTFDTMEVGEWSATDIALKTDTAAVLECLQRSMADDDDEDFLLLNNSVPDGGSCANHLSSLQRSVSRRTAVYRTDKVRDTPSTGGRPGDFGSDDSTSSAQLSVHVDAAEPSRTDLNAMSALRHAIANPPKRWPSRGHGIRVIHMRVIIARHTWICFASEKYAPSWRGRSCAGLTKSLHIRTFSCGWELLSTLPSVSELKADLSTYCGDRTLGVRRSAEATHGHLELRGGPSASQQSRPTTFSTYFPPAAGMVSVCGPQQASQAGESAVAFPTGSDFTTLTNASSSQATTPIADQYTRHQYYNGNGIPDQVGNTAEVQLYTHTQHHQLSTPYSELHQTQSLGQGQLYPEATPPPPSYSSAVYPTAASCDAYYQDVYSPSGRQSTSCIPSDLQQVTPTIQDLGTSIPSVPPPVTPVTHVVESPAVKATSQPSPASRDYYSSSGVRVAADTSGKVILEDIGAASGVRGRTGRGAGVQTSAMPYDAKQTSTAVGFDSQSAPLTADGPTYGACFTSTQSSALAHHPSAETNGTYSCVDTVLATTGNPPTHSQKSMGLCSGVQSTASQATSQVSQPTNDLYPDSYQYTQSGEGHKEAYQCHYMPRRSQPAPSYSHHGHDGHQYHHHHYQPHQSTHQSHQQYDQSLPNTQPDYRHGTIPAQGHASNVVHPHTYLATGELSATLASSSSASYPRQYHAEYHGDAEQAGDVYQNGSTYQVYQDGSPAVPNQQQHHLASAAAHTIAGSSAAQMFHDALEYIAPEVVQESRDGLFNPIAALTDTLLENNFDMSLPPGYAETCDTIAPDAVQPYSEIDAKQDQPRKAAKASETQRKRDKKLLEVIKVYRCKACGFRSSDKLKALRHTIESHSRPKLNRQARFACGACHLHFATLDSCCEHIGSKHPTIATAVLKDGKLFKQVLIHAEKKAAKPSGGAATPEGPQSKNGRQEAEAQAHKIAWKRKIDREQGQYVCQLKGCTMRFRLEESHRYHLRCHLPHPSELERFQCPIGECRLGCRRWATMANHLWNSHRVDLELQACNRCDFKTYSLANLEKVHKLVHSEEKQFACEQCQSHFRTNKQLKNHRYTQHSHKVRRLKTLACPHCRQEMLKKNLGAHIRQVHEGRVTERHCPNCDFKTTSIAELKAHLSSVHRNESAVHCCHQCGFLTHDYNVHRKHALQHSADKPYKCAFCPYASIQASTYKTHLRKAHPEKARELIARCPHCPFDSISTSRLQQHISRCHNSSNNSNNNNNNNSGGNMISNPVHSKGGKGGGNSGITPALSGAHLKNEKITFLER